jgi:DNA-binding MarR family transcriptional regulator
MSLPPTAPVLRAGRRFDSAEQEAYLHLWRTYDRLKALEDELFEPLGLSAQQYNALRLLRAVAPETLTVQWLATRLISRAPDMTRLLDRLAERGLIDRARRVGNRRIVDVSLTSAGRDLLDELADPVRACHRRQLGHLSEEQLRTLVGLLSLAREPHEEPGSPWQRAAEENDQCRMTE